MNKEKSPAKESMTRIFRDLINGVDGEVIIKNYNNIYVFPSGFLYYDYEQKTQIILDDDGLLLKEINGEDMWVLFNNILNTERNNNSLYLFRQKDYYDIILIFNNEEYTEAIEGLIREKININ